MPNNIINITSEAVPMMAATSNNTDSIYIGNTEISEIYLGNTKISEIYIGNTKIY